MYGDEFSKIKAAVDAYVFAESEIERLKALRQSLDDHRKQKQLLKITVVGNSSSYDIPQHLQISLYDWIDSQLSRQQSLLRKSQAQITCPAATAEQ